MIAWVFIYSAATLGAGNAFSIGFESAEICRAYAQAYVARAESTGIRTAECVGLRSGQIEDFKK